jgi:transcriptional regulator with XRE-family HTH domain
MRVARVDKLLRERVRALRLERGMSQFELAMAVRRFGWRDAVQQRINEIECGRKRLRTEELAAIAAALGTDGNWIVDGIGLPGRAVTIEGARAEAQASARHS